MLKCSYLSHVECGSSTAQCPLSQILPFSITEQKMSRGVNENNQLKGKLEAQLHRLLDQLEDINRDRDSLEEEEYNELRNDTMEQVGSNISKYLSLGANIC